MPKMLWEGVSLQDVTFITCNKNIFSPVQTEVQQTGRLAEVNKLRHIWKHNSRPRDHICLTFHAHI